MQMLVLGGSGRIARAVNLHIRDIRYEQSRRALPNDEIWVSLSAMDLVIRMSCGSSVFAPYPVSHIPLAVTVFRIPRNQNSIVRARL